MKTLQVLRAGACDLVIDRGRPGFAHLGVPLGGAADRRAFAQANRLVGNSPDAAGLEIALAGPVLAFPHGATVALTGAAFALRRSAGKAAPHGQALELEPGEALCIGTAAAGCRCWLAVRGGIDVPVVLGSRSTFLPSQFGGFEGRALRAGDVLAIGGDARTDALSTPATEPIATEPIAIEPTAAKPAPVRASRLHVIPGPQAAAFGDAGLAAFFTQPFRVTAASDRRGLRLGGAAVAPMALPMGLPDPASQAVLPGAIQIPPDGQPIILGWDGPVTGGYPVIAGLVSADLPQLAQLKPGDTLRFATMTVDAARELARAGAQNHGT
jgi:biotin-dependent carboxylase uncharacterized domain